MFFIGIHVVLCAITLWFYLHRYMFEKNEFWWNLIIILGIHILLLSIYFWYFHVHDDGYRLFKSLKRVYDLF